MSKRSGEASAQPERSPDAAALQCAAPPVFALVKQGQPSTDGSARTDRNGNRQLSGNQNRRSWGRQQCRPHLLVGTAQPGGTVRRCAAPVLVHTKTRRCCGWPSEWARNSHNPTMPSLSKHCLSCHRARGPKKSAVLRQAQHERDEFGWRCRVQDCVGHNIFVSSCEPICAKRYSGAKSLSGRSTSAKSARSTVTPASTSLRPCAKSLTLLTQSSAISLPCLR